MATLSFLIALLIVAVVVIADDSNILLTGEVLANDGQLTYKDTSFIIQDDCNLVLYNNRNGFQSNTHAAGVNCTLTLNDVGQLIINSFDGSPVWTSTFPPNKKGKYAAVLRPDGQVVVYGPSLWSTPSPQGSTADASSMVSELGIIPMVRNVLFSSQILYNNATLATRDYELVMGMDCNLAVTKAGSGALWESGTAGKGKHCFLRLDHRGGLSVEDDRSKIVWASKPVGKVDGAYVLILQIHGQAVVYGPVVWSTASS